MTRNKNGYDEDFLAPPIIIDMDLKTKKVNITCTPIGDGKNY